MRLATPNRAHLFALLALLTPFDVSQTAIAQTDLDWLQTQPEGSSIHLLHMPAWDSTTVFASVEARGIWSFDLETEQWTMRNEGIPPAYNVYTLKTSEYLVPYPDAFASSPAIPGKLWCLYSSVGIIYEYNDTTETWSQYSENVPRAGDTPWLHIDDENPDLVFLSGVVPPQWRTPEDVVYVSHDRGLTWSSIDTLVSGPILELHHSVPGRLVIGDYYSDDDGQTWTRHFEYGDGEMNIPVCNWLKVLMMARCGRLRRK